MLKSSSIPITSPVLFISGPKITSVFGNLLKTKTASLIAKYGNDSGLKSINSLDKDFPAISSAAILMKGIPMAFARNGIVLLALGLASRIYISLSLMAYCTFINPTVPNSLARLSLKILIELINSLLKENGGIQQALSPE